MLDLVVRKRVQESTSEPISILGHDSGHDHLKRTRQMSAVCVRLQECHYPSKRVDTACCMDEAQPFELLGPGSTSKKTVGSYRPRKHVGRAVAGQSGSGTCTPPKEAEEGLAKAFGWSLWMAMNRPSYFKPGAQWGEPW